MKTDSTYLKDTSAPQYPLGRNDGTSTLSQRIIEPSKAWQWPDIKELWEYRDLMFFMVWRDLTSRYRQTALGPLWILLQPLMSMVLYTFLFGVIAQMPSEGKPYAVYSYVALLPWGFFSTAFSAGVNSLSSGISLSSKVYFPRLVVALSNIISSLVDLTISFLILLGMITAYGITPNWGIVYLPIFLFIAAITGLGFGLWFSGLVVRYRDVSQITSFLMRIWMYVTPVVYSSEIVPENLRPLYRLNPMTGVVDGFRWALLNTQEAPQWLYIGFSTVVAFIALAIGLLIFRRAERDIVDVA
jgi:lipopolysaccharide transport system permease protein